MWEGVSCEGACAGVNMVGIKLTVRSNLPPSHLLFLCPPSLPPSLPLTLPLSLTIRSMMISSGQSPGLSASPSSSCGESVVSVGWWREAMRVMA